MKKNEKKDLRDQPIEKLRKQLIEARDQLFRLRMDHSRHTLKNTSGLHTKRNEIAILETLLREKQLIEAAKAKSA